MWSYGMEACNAIPLLRLQRSGFIRSSVVRFSSHEYQALLRKVDAVKTARKIRISDVKLWRSESSLCWVTHNKLSTKLCGILRECRLTVGGHRSLETSSAEVVTDRLHPKAKPAQQNNSGVGTRNQKTAAKPKERTGSVLQKGRNDSELWSRVKTWVVFSDLHVSRRTLDTCLQVLKEVHREAARRDAGIIFLGDFWHSRGSLPVELLNVIVPELSGWSRPAIFIPGNHDQVNLGGQMHALSVLGAVNPVIKVIDDPLEFLGALWLPFRRDHNIINKALEQHLNVKAIFAHVDVVGAFMNEGFQAREGVQPSIFPEKIPVYTGHYHKPHVVENTVIEYVGSPYQVSATETGQTKRFLILDSEWKGRHFVVSEVKGEDLDEIHHIRNGDRVRLLLSTPCMEDNLKTKLKLLQRRGVQVDLVFPTVSVKPRIEKAESLNAFGLFSLYAERVNMSVEAKSEGLKLLHDMELPAKLVERTQVQLVLHDVEMQGFGPFVEVVKYPLYQRGIRVVCGKNLDSDGADSNGSGKSTLVMAPLWALSGTTDPRPESMRGLSTLDVINEKAKSARVSVNGNVNGKPFFVERVAGRKPSLKFIYNEKDCTGQDMKLTQAKIDEIIDTSMLQRVAFYGQYGLGGLLEASDKEFKDELSKVLALDVWVAAKKQSSQDLRSKLTEVDVLGGEITQLASQKSLIEKKVQESKCRVEEWENNWTKRCEVMEEKRSISLGDLEQIVSELHAEYQRLLECTSDLEHIVIYLEENAQPEDDEESSAYAAEEADRQTRELLLRRSAELSVEIKTVGSVRNRNRQKTEEYVRNFSMSEVCDKCLQAVNQKHTSRTVLNLEKELFQSEEACTRLAEELNLVERELERVTDKITKGMHEREEALKYRRSQAAGYQKISAAWKRTGLRWLRWSLIQSLVSQMKQIHESLAVAKTIAKSSFNFLNTVTSSKTSPSYDINEVAEHARDGFQTSDFSRNLYVEGKLGDMREKNCKLELVLQEGNRLNEEVEQLNQSLQVLKAMTNPFEAEYAAMKNVLASLKVSQVEKEQSLKDVQKYTNLMKELDSAFSHTGVQSYIFEAALAELQERTASHLNTLSGGSLGLLLSPTKPNKRSKTMMEAIDRVALVRRSTGENERRSVRQLSGGERRRLALAVALGFSEFAANRSGLHCDILVLDEVLQHLDSEGKGRMIAVLKGLTQGTILLVSQTYGDVADLVESVDLVVKDKDTSRIELST